MGKGTTVSEVEVITQSISRSMGSPIFGIRYSRCLRSECNLIILIPTARVVLRGVIPSKLPTKTKVCVSLSTLLG